ncbi:MAG: hypothetical protein ACK4UN_15710 [Limisphaerales bacterium]
MAITQRGHKPAGAFTGKGALHCGQFFEGVVLTLFTYQSTNDCYVIDT